jgi:uncharacterized protein YjiK
MGGYAFIGYLFMHYTCMESERRVTHMEHTCKSEVAWQLEQIKLQYEAAQRGLHGLAQGTARHAFIAAKMKSMGQIHQELQRLVGPDQAIQLVAETLQASADSEDDQEAHPAVTAENEAQPGQL